MNEKILSLNNRKRLDLGELKSEDFIAVLAKSLAGKYKCNPFKNSYFLEEFNLDLLKEVLQENSRSAEIKAFDEQLLMFIFQIKTDTNNREELSQFSRLKKEYISKIKAEHRLKNFEQKELEEFFSEASVRINANIYGKILKASQKKHITATKYINNVLLEYLLEKENN